jgi:hypothetical protein
VTDRAQSLFGPEGEPCAQCGAPLAADQRYCLACGARRAAARLPFLDILRRDDEQAAELVPFGTPIAPVAAVIPPPPHDGSLASQLRANTGLIAGVGVLLLAMLIGVLIGSGFGNDNSSANANQRPQVISVGAPAAAAPAAAAPTATTPTATTPTETTPSSTSGDTSSGTSSSGTKGGNSSVKKLQGLSGKAYQKQVDKLGKKISTGGKPPPKDHKPAAGGGSFESIG